MTTTRVLESLWALVWAEESSSKWDLVAYEEPFIMRLTWDLGFKV